MPKISFLIATKNHQAVIKETLESLLNQTVDDWEAIIVNDHGNDNTATIIQEMNDRRFRYYNLPDVHGFGASCARNYAAIQAQSNILAILDSDDLAYSNRVKVTVDAFAKTPGAEVFYGNLDIWESQKNIVHERKTPVWPFSLEKLKELNFIPHSTVAIKRSLLLNNPYNPFFRIAEDYDLWSRLALQGKLFVYSAEKVLKYRLWNKNITNSKSFEDVKNYTLLVKMCRGWIPFDEKLLYQVN
ncbi:MAG: glycosyltransferase [Patescibacteria group bacterium]|nr:glycosyltransferase [Patescibacteria group bacterium]